MTAGDEIGKIVSWENFGYTIFYRHVFTYMYNMHKVSLCLLSLCSLSGGECE